jgi:hypothetical protein
MNHSDPAAGASPGRDKTDLPIQITFFYEAGISRELKARWIGEIIER